MSEFLIVAFLFFIGSASGWIIELIFRRFFSDSNPERKWINPGFCVGPYLPIYGFGLCIMYMITAVSERIIQVNSFSSTLLVLLCIAVCMTLIEYIAGILSIKVMKARLWDYSNRPGNIQGVICPLFSLIWSVAGAGYYFLLHSHIQGAIAWLSQNLAFSFVIGMFYGIFLIDIAYSTNMMVRVREFAARNDVIVKYEHLKAHIQTGRQRAKQKPHFFLALHSQRPIGDWLKEMYIEEHSSNRKKPKHSQ